MKSLEICSKRQFDLLDFRIFHNFHLSWKSFISINCVIVNGTFNYNGVGIVFLCDGTGATTKSATESALPVYDAVCLVMTLVDEVVDQKSFVPHSGVEVHCLMD